jgi:hypothetical protein
MSMCCQQALSQVLLAYADGDTGGGSQSVSLMGLPHSARAQACAAGKHRSVAFAALQRSVSLSAGLPVKANHWCACAPWHGVRLQPSLQLHGADCKATHRQPQPLCVRQNNTDDGVVTRTTRPKPMATGLAAKASAWVWPLQL